MSAGDREIMYVERSVQMPDGSYETRSVEQASDGNVGGLIGQRSYRCVICGRAFKEGQVQMFRGKPYGVPCGDYKDIKSILMKERADRIRGRFSDESASGVIHFTEGG